MPESGNPGNLQSFEPSAASVGAEMAFNAPRLEVFSMPPNHEERLEWVKKSCERFFEKILELDARLGLPELN